MSGKRRKATNEEVRMYMLAHISKVLLIDRTGRSMFVWQWDPEIVPAPGDQFTFNIPRDFYWEESNGKKQLVWDADPRGVRVN